MTITSESTTAEFQHTLGHKVIGKIRGTFWVPSYQRGYRWDTGDVTRLLDDIWSSEGQEYNLQPVVVKLHKRLAEDQICEWELIDGQQRLTTLYLILHYMQRQGWKKMGAPYTIRYQTRPNSQEYLTTLDQADSEKNIDYFHLYKAYDCINNWFQKHGDAFDQEAAANKFHGYLFESVRIIWYEAPPSEISTELFTRLNVGRIPLTDAELVKALLLSGVRKGSPDRVHELASQWDSIERDLHDPDVWAFVSGSNTWGQFEQYPTRISLLLDTLADRKNKPIGRRPRYHTFDTLREEIEKDPIIFWNQVVELHALILGWFSDPDLYNKIGFLVSSCYLFNDVVALAKNKKKSEFNVSLVNTIRDSVIRMSASDLLDLSYEDKKRGYPKLLQLLLLMNVETVSRTSQRFPFRRHLGNEWSLEHIHAQNAESLTTVDQWEAWLKTHKQALSTLPDNHDLLLQEIKDSLKVINTARNFGDTFRQLSAKVIAVFEAPSKERPISDHGLHSISNMALLSCKDNSALSNSVFEVKRQKVLEIDRNVGGKKDGYIPICTRNVFLKYYAGTDAQQMHFWSMQDRESYYKAILLTLGKYLQNVSEPEENLDD